MRSSKEQVAGSRCCCLLSYHKNNKICSQRKNSERKTCYLLPAAYYLLLLLFFISVSAFSQTTPYLIPRQIYIGDPATLVVPFTDKTASNIVVTTNLPVHENIDFHKLTLQSDRLLIEFTAFVPGEIELPLIEIGGYYFPNLKITVNSIIDRSNAITLSAPAPSLAMPGTAFMLYGTLAAIVFIIAGSIWFAVKGKKIFSTWKEKWKRWRLFTGMRQIERRLNKSLQKGADIRLILNKLSDEFRDFLSILLKQNCRAMTARELGSLQLQENINLDASFLENFFTLTDNYRFSGVSADTNAVLKLLNSLREFIGVMEREEKNQKKEETEIEF